MITTISLAAAQEGLAEAVKRTEAGPVYLEDGGKPVAVLVSLGEYRRLSRAGLRERESLSQEAY